MKQKHIDMSRELRLWIGQVIIPGIVATGMLASNPQLRCAVLNKVNDIKSSFKYKFKK